MIRGNNEKILLIQSIWPHTKTGKWIDRKFIENLVSIIIPTYNREKYIIDTLNSVESQTYRPIELIIVDDGSTDKSNDIISNWIEKKQVVDEFTVRYIRQDNGGANSARNKGFLNSMGEFIQFLDSDDIIHPDKIELEVMIFNKFTNIDYVWSQEYCYKDGEKIDFLSIDRNNLTNKLIQNYFPEGIVGVNHRGLFRREIVYSSGPWNENLHRYQDAEFMMRCGSLGINSTFIKDIHLYYFRQHNSVERIFNFNYSEIGVNYLFNSLNSIELCQKKMLIYDYPTRKKISKHYLNLSYSAAKYSSKKSVLKALSGIIRQKPNSVMIVKAYILYIICAIFGRKVFLKLLCTYSYVSGGGGFERND